MKPLAASLLAGLVACVGLTVAPAQAPKVGPDQKTWDAVVASAVRYVKSTQEAGGGWSTAKSPGVTGIVLTGLLRSGIACPGPDRGESPQVHREPGQPREEAHRRQGPEGPAAELRHQHQRDGPRAANQADKYKAIIGDAVKFLKKLQWDEGEGKDAQERLLRRRRLRQQVAARPVQHAVLPRRPQGRRHLARRSRPSRRRWSSSAAARTSRASTTTSPGPGRSTTAASSTPPRRAASPRSSTSRCPTAACPATAA